jgi:hypothetical protein
LYNQTSSAWEESNQYRLGNSSVIDFCKNLSALNVDSIFNKDRNIIQSVLNVGTIAKKGFYFLNHPWGELDYSPSVDMLRMIQLKSHKAMMNWTFKREIIETHSDNKVNLISTSSQPIIISNTEILREINYLIDLTYDYDRYMQRYGRRLKKSSNPKIVKLGQLFIDIKNS